MAAPQVVARVVAEAAQGPALTPEGFKLWLSREPIIVRGLERLALLPRLRVVVGRLSAAIAAVEVPGSRPLYLAA